MIDIQKIAIDTLNEQNAFIQGEEEFNKLILQGFLEQVSIRVGTHLLEQLSESDRYDYDVMIEKNASEETIQKFFKLNVQNYNEVVQNAVTEFVGEYKDL